MIVGKYADMLSNDPLNAAPGRRGDDLNPKLLNPQPKFLGPRTCLSWLLLLRVVDA